MRRVFGERLKALRERTMRRQGDQGQTAAPRRGFREKEKAKKHQKNSTEV